jgi:hypothetical protein
MSYSQLYTGSSALNSTFSPGRAFCLEEVRLNLSTFSTAAVDFTVTLNSGYSSTNIYNARIKTQSITTATNTYAYQPTVPHRFTSSNDKLVVAYANPSTRTYGIEIVWRPNE